MHSNFITVFPLHIKHYYCTVLLLLVDPSIDGLAVVANALGEPHLELRGRRTSGLDNADNAASEKQ